MQNEKKNYYHQALMKRELEKRVSKNSRYSLRSFAKALTIGASDLSLILAGKRPISTKIVERIFTSLEMSESEKNKFLQSVLLEKSDLGLQRVSPKLHKKVSLARQSAKQDTVLDVGLDQFRIISDWYHYAILELTVVEGFRSDMKWIAKTLSISEIEARLAIDRLLSLELLQKAPGGAWVKKNLKSDTRDKSKTSQAHRKRQKQILSKSVASLEQDPIEIRNHSSLTLAVNPAQIAEAKKRIEAFVWELGQFLGEGKKTEVYELNLSLFPLTHEN